MIFVISSNTTWTLSCFQRYETQLDEVFSREDVGTGCRVILLDLPVLSEGTDT